MDSGERMFLNEKMSLGERVSLSERMFKGIGVSEGIGIGSVVVITNEIPHFKEIAVVEEKIETERFIRAVDQFCEKTLLMAEKIRSEIGPKEAEILKGQVLMISDPAMQEEVKYRIKHGQCAESALSDACDMFIQLFLMTDEEMTKQRTSDIEDIKVRIINILQGIEDVKISDLPPETILAVQNLTPSMLAGINKNHVVGILSETGGITSHSAIIARTLEIPAVFGIDNITGNLENGETAIIEGSTGIAIVSPDKDERKEYQKKKEAIRKEKEVLHAYIGKETRTADGVTARIFGNVGSIEESRKVKEYDGEGIGLFRTEFLFMEKEKFPTEEEQYEVYKETALIMKGKAVLIRTLDIGGDKSIPYLSMEKEENPSLGYRAIRFCLDHKEILRTQLKAMLRASAFGNIKIMIPFVTCNEEFRSVNTMLEELKREFDEEGIAYRKNIETGVMIETPAASLIADILAKEADFFSIGTNDLIQYTMAADRGNTRVSEFYSVYQPAVLRSIRHIIECADKEKIPVGMCGEAACDPLLIPLLISFGLNEYSVSASSILETRKAIAGWTKQEADLIADKVMRMNSAAEIKKFLYVNRK